MSGYQLRVLLVPHDKRFISWSRGKAIGVAGHRGVVKAREACLNGVGVSSGRFGIASSEHDGARVEPARAARVRGSFPCDLRRAVPLEATDSKGVLASLQGPVVAPYHPSLAGQGSAELRRHPLSIVHAEFDLR